MACARQRGFDGANGRQVTEELSQELLAATV
jgi:hypothetical protein